MFIETTTGPASAVVPTQLSVAMASGYLLWLLQKAQSVPWISQNTAKLNALIRLIVSGASTIGINIAWSGATHTLTISNLSFWIVLTGLWHWFTQYAATHGFEKILNIIPSTAVAAGVSGPVVPVTEPAPPKAGV